MNLSKTLAVLAVLTALAGLTSAPAAADGWRHHYRGYAQPRHARRLYRGGGINYYNSAACSYGDCQCLRARALATGSPVWWDRYQACTG
jgi:hypothetical protein